MLELIADAVVRVPVVLTLNEFALEILVTKKLPLKVAPAALEVKGVPGDRPCALRVVIVTLDVPVEIAETVNFDVAFEKMPPRRTTA
jgi:hypothetical protein